MKIKFWIVLIVVAIVSLIALREKRVQELSNTAPLPSAPWALRAVKIKRGAVEAGFPILATISTSSEITVTGQVSGELLKMGPREGVAVKKGELLAKVDTSEIEDNISSLHAKLKAAEETARREDTEFTREQTLFKEGGSTQSALDARRNSKIAAEQNVAALQKSIDALEVKQSFGTINAPSNGVIQERLAEIGDVCIPGHPLYRMTASGGFRIKAQLPQNVVEKTHVGTMMRLDWHGESLLVPISRIYPALNRQALGAVEADINTLPFTVPLHARISGRIIESSVKDALIVPAEAILKKGESHFVFSFHPISLGEYKLVRKSINILLDAENKTAVSGDIQAGDLVVSAQKGTLLRLQNEDRAVPQFEDGNEAALSTKNATETTL